MPKKNPEKATTTPATPNDPAPMPARFADRPISDLASSTSLRMSVDTSAIALWTRAPTEGSSGRPVGRLDAEAGAPAGSSLVDGGVDMIVPDARRSRAPRPGERGVDPCAGRARID